nr:nuclear transport factor 2 family protein [Brevundimonas diminuta]
MTPTLHPAAAVSLAKWHDMVTAQDLGGLRAITHPDAVFRSPVAHKAYHSAEAVVLAVSVFSDFAYHREATTADGLSVVLEFSAKVGDKRVKGIDFIRFDEDGRIVDFEVMMRPLSGVQAMAEEMGKRLGAILPAFKGD